MLSPQFYTVVLDTNQYSSEDTTLALLFRQLVVFVSNVASDIIFLQSMLRSSFGVLFLVVCETCLIWLELSNLRIYAALLSLPEFIKEQFTGVSTIASRILRSSNLSLRPPKLKSRHGQNCFAHRGSSVWNSLPNELKSSRTVRSFRKKLKAMLAKKKARKIILAFYSSYVFRILLCKIYLVVYVHSFVSMIFISFLISSDFLGAPTNHNH